MFEYLLYLLKILIYTQTFLYSLTTIEFEFSVSGKVSILGGKMICLLWKLVKILIPPHIRRETSKERNPFLLYKIFFPIEDIK